VDQYSPKVEDLLEAALQLFSIDVAGKAVLLKPNLVDYLPGDAINTHPSLVLAAAACFRRLGATSVEVGGGQGISATRNWYCPRADMRTAFAVRRSDLLT